jgi:hypothetical protein
MSSRNRWEAIREIVRLRDLRDKGVISDKDFQNLKKQQQLILGGQPIQGDDQQKEEFLKAGRLDLELLDLGQGLAGNLRVDHVDASVGSPFAREPKLEREEMEPRSEYADRMEHWARGRGGLRGSVRMPRTRPGRRRSGITDFYFCSTCLTRVGKTARFCENCGLQL